MCKYESLSRWVPESECIKVDIDAKCEKMVLRFAEIEGIDLKESKLKSISNKIFAHVKLNFDKEGISNEQLAREIQKIVVENLSEA
ncbi:MAG: hypothetical protein ABIH83_05605, partial [Candidatus Micrarchaeota archaeon]